jgi:hypothetical protein
VVVESCGRVPRNAGEPGDYRWRCTAGGIVIIRGATRPNAIDRPAEREMPLSQNPEQRSNQLANLRSSAALTHGAHSSAVLAPLREQYAVELGRAFPSASSGEIGLLAHLQAQLSVLGDWMDRRGLLANRQRGTVFPAVQLHERIAAAFERQYAALLEREQATAEDPHALYREIEAEYAAGKVAVGADSAH